jgi:hypothetical protein
VVIKSKTALGAPLIVTAFVTLVLPLEFFAAAGGRVSLKPRTLPASAINKNPLTVLIVVNPPFILSNSRTRITNSAGRHGSADLIAYRRKKKGCGRSHWCETGIRVEKSRLFKSRMILDTCRIKKLTRDPPG